MTSRSRRLPSSVSRDLTEASRFSPGFHSQAGSVSRVHSRLYFGERTTAGTGRYPTVLSGDPTVGSPDVADARTRRTDLAAAGSAAKHCRSGGSFRLTRVGAGIRSTGQNHCDEVLGRCQTVKPIGSGRQRVCLSFDRCCFGGRVEYATSSRKRNSQ